MQKCRINPAWDEGCYQESGEGTEINSSSIEEALGLLSWFDTLYFFSRLSRFRKGVPSTLTKSCSA